jgi:hypothetical protein
LQYNKPSDNRITLSGKELKLLSTILDYFYIIRLLLLLKDL